MTFSRLIFTENTEITNYLIQSLSLPLICAII